MAKIAASAIDGVEVFETHIAFDERGSMSRLWPTSAAPADFVVHQVLLSRNLTKHTLRGMHFQRGSSSEQKIVGALRGRLLDVFVDLRTNSATYLDWAGVELSGDEQVAVLLPRGIAHGFLTLEDNTEVSYLVDHAYEPTRAIGIRWDDPLVGIEWPVEPSVIADRDRSWPLIERGFSSIVG